MPLPAVPLPAWQEQRLEKPLPAVPIPAQGRGLAPLPAPARGAAALPAKGRGPALLPAPVGRTAAPRTQGNGLMPLLARLSSMPPVPPRRPGPAQTVSAAASLLRRTEPALAVAPPRSKVTEELTGVADHLTVAEPGCASLAEVAGPPAPCCPHCGWAARPRLQGPQLVTWEHGPRGAGCQGRRDSAQSCWTPPPRPGRPGPFLEAQKSQARPRRCRRRRRCLELLCRSTRKRWPARMVRCGRRGRRELLR